MKRITAVLFGATLGATACNASTEPTTSQPDAQVSGQDMRPNDNFSRP